MSEDKKAAGGDYKVGYGKPPSEHQFKKGKSGNLAGRPKKKKGHSVDAAAILNEPLLVKKAGTRQTMPSYEVVVRRLVERALKHKDLRAMLEFLKLCETHRLLVLPKVEEIGGLYHAPRGVNYHEWAESMEERYFAALRDADEDEID